MKNCTTLFFSLLLCNMLSAQLNMTYKSNVTYDESLNDIWGYVAPDDREYAIVGLNGGVSIIDVTDTENPEIKGYANGPSSTWRDIKTYGSYAYVTNETSDGLLVIDLSNLPNQLTEDDYWYWSPDIPGLGQMTSCHNIYIDEFGYAYLVGCDVNSGGALFIDVFTNPGSPEFIAAGAPIYAHDIYVRDNITYNSEIYEGAFTAYDVTDKANPVALGGHATPFDFTHNAWLSDDSNFIFTTDERADAPVAAYDISDLNDIQEVDQFKPLETLGAGVIPHNVHVWSDWLIISYYTDGCIIVDGARPHNLVEVGNFDTFIPASTGFSGAWGAYPYLPSGTVLVSDISNGCYILEPNYVRACYLEGKVTDIASGLEIQGASIDIVTDELNQSSTNFSGEYATGLAISGTYEVIFSHPSYESVTATAELENGVVTILNVQLGLLPVFNFSGQVIDAQTGNPINNAEVFIDGPNQDYESATDVNGNFSLSSVVGGSYNIYAEEWGYLRVGIAMDIDGNNIEPIQLQRGYADDFFFDHEWTVESNASSGIWERGNPIGTFQNNGNTIVNPSDDTEEDLGEMCFVTGNEGGGVGNDDVDNGYTRLISPVMDLENYNEPVLIFDYWFFNGGGDGSPNDNLTVSIDNGIETVLLETFTESTDEWTEIEINFGQGTIEMTNNMRVIFETSDQVNDDNGHLVEAGIDAFEVLDSQPVATSDLDEFLGNLTASPNPFSDALKVSYQFEAIPNQATLYVYNVLGQVVDNITLDNIEGEIEINSIRENGIYFLQIEADGSLMKAMRVVKQ